MSFWAKSPSRSSSPSVCPRHGEACKWRGRETRAPFAATERVPSGAAVRIRRLARNPLVWFVVGFALVHVLRDAGILPDLDWLPGEPIR